MLIDQNTMPKTTTLLYSVDGEVFDIENKIGACCWWDFEPFKGIAFTIPTKPRTHKKWTVCGVYCSANCAKAEIQRDRCNSSTRLLWFKQLLEEVYAFPRFARIPAAFPRSELVKLNPKHGMSIKDFRARCKDSRIQVITPPLMMLTQKVWMTTVTAGMARSSEELAKETPAPVKNFEYKKLDAFMKKKSNR